MTDRAHEGSDWLSPPPRITHDGPCYDSLFYEDPVRIVPIIFTLVAG